MIALLLPTRNRPKELKRFFDSVKETADHPEDIIISVYMDEDDKSYQGMAWEGPPDICFSIGPRITLSSMWNRCYDEVSDRAEIFGHLGDDIIFRTKGWDTKIKQTFEEYPDKIAFVYGNDGSGVHDGIFGTHGFIHKKWVETVGRFAAPYFVSDYTDTWLNDVAKLIGRHRHIDILTEHMHYVFGKSKYDKTYEERIARHGAENPGALYHSPKMTMEREAEAEKLRGVMDVRP